MEQKITRARELTHEIPHAVIATANSDGSPHNTPVFGAFDHDMNFYWSSSPGSNHSRNIARSGQIFLVLLDTRQGNGCLYMAGAAEQLDGSVDFDHAYGLLAAAKAARSAPMATRETYDPANGTQRIYRAMPRKLWVSISTKDANGAVIHDQREEIPLAGLRQPMV